MCRRSTRLWQQLRKQSKNQQMPYLIKTIHSIKGVPLIDYCDWLIHLFQTLKLPTGCKIILSLAFEWISNVEICMVRFMQSCQISLCLWIYHTETNGTGCSFWELQKQCFLDPMLVKLKLVWYAVVYLKNFKPTAEKGRIFLILFL